MTESTQQLLARIPEIEQKVTDYSKADLGFLVLALCKAVQELSAENERLQLVVDGKTFVTRELANPWVSVKERLPEDHVPIIVKVEGTSESLVGYYFKGNGWFYGWNNAGSYFLTSDWMARGPNYGGHPILGGDFQKKPFVTHWAPLPSPPQEAQEKP